MASNFSFSDITKFGSQGLDSGGPGSLAGVASNQSTPTPTEAKAARVEASSKSKTQAVDMSNLTKTALYGSEEEQRVLATADINGNDIAMSEAMDDIRNLNPLQWDQKYGWGTSNDRAGFIRAKKDVDHLTGRERTTQNAVSDTAMSAGLAAFNMAALPAQLGAVALDKVVGTDISPDLAQGLGNVTDYVHSNQSDLLNERREQNARAQELNLSDRKDEREQDLAEGKDGTLDYLSHQGKIFWDSVKGIVNDPILLADTIPEAVGSIAGIAGIIRGLSKQAVKRALKAEGNSPSEIKRILRSKDGKDRITKEGTRIAPAVVGATEGGAASSGVQQQIMGMSPDELAESEEYQQLRQSGKSHEEAQRALAVNAGALAGATGLPAGAVIGKIPGSFPANPLGTGAKGTGFGSSIKGGLSNVGKETVEETLQEGANQVSINNALARSAGLDVALDEGVSAGAAQGFVGGVTGTAAIQAPAVAAGTVKETVKSAADGVSAGIEARDNKLQAQDEADTQANSPVAGDAQDRTIADAEEAGTNLITSLAPETDVAVPEVSDTGEVTPDQTTTQEPNPEAETISNTVRDAISMDPDETAQNKEAFPDLEVGEDGRSSRFNMIRHNAAVARNEDNDPGTRQLAALGILQDFDQMRKVDSDEMANSVAALEFREDIKENFEKLKQSVNALESSDDLKAAQQIITKMTEADVANLLPIEVLEDPNASPEDKAQITELVDLMSRYKLDQISKDDFDVVLNQESIDPDMRKRLEAAREMARVIDEADTSRDDNQRNREKETGQRSKTAQGHLGRDMKRSKNIVREEILMDGNKDNKLKSLTDHKYDIDQAFRAGRIKEGLDNLSELEGFARSQTAKNNAFEQALDNGNTRSSNPVTYQAYGPFKKFFEQKDGVFVDLTNPNSVAVARDINVDAIASVGFYNALVDAYGDQLDGKFEKLPIPELDPRLKAAKSAPIETDPTPKEPKQYRPRKTTVSTNDNKVVDNADDPDATETSKKVAERVRKSVKPKPSKKPRARSEPRKKPFIDELKKAGIRIDPDGVVGRELMKGRDVAKKDVPGLLRQGGYVDLDNIEPGLNAYMDEVIGLDDTGNYYNQDELIEAIVSEAYGTPVQDANEVELTRNQEEKARYGEEQEDQAGKADPSNQAVESNNSAPEQQSSAPRSEAADESSEGTGGTESVTVQTKTPETPAVKTWMDSIKGTVYQTKDGVNYFLDSFKPRKNPSTLTAHVDPAQFIRDNIDSLVQENNSLSHEMTPDQQKHITDLLTNILPDFADKMEAMRQETAKDKKWNEKTKEGKDFLFFPEAKAMNFAVKADVGSSDGMVLDQRVVQASYMAAMEWVLQNNSRGVPPMDTEAVSKMFGLGRNGHVTKEMFAHARKGMQLQSALDVVSKKIEALVGVEALKNVPSNETQGIFRHMAANALVIMEDQGFIETHKMPFNDFMKSQGLDPKNKKDEGNVSVPTVIEVKESFRKDPESQQLIADMDSLRDPFTQIFVPDAEKERYIGKAPEGTKKTLMGNNLAPVSKTQTKVMERLQKMPATLNTSLIDLWTALGDQSLNELMGHKPLDEKRMNKMTYESRKGKNQSLERAVKETRAYITAAQKQSDGKLLGEVEIFFDWAVSSVGRLQQQGPITPQGDKWAREIMSSTWSTIDITDPSSVDMNTFWLAVAQSLDISIEKQPHADSIREAQKLVQTGALTPAMQALKDRQNGSDLDFQTVSDSINTMKEVTPKALHALDAVAQLENAQAKGETTLTTALAIEADGKTDGPINAMVHMLTGAFTPGQIERFAKGGLFFTGQPMSLSEFMEAEKRANKGTPGFKHKDLYQTAADLFKTILMKQDQQGDAPARTDVLKLLHSFLDDFEMGLTEDGKISDYDIKRGITKNPLTVFIYGSSEGGIADKITKALMDNVYEMLSNYAAAVADGKNEPLELQSEFQENSELMTVMETLMGKNVLSRMKEDPAQAFLSKEEFDNLSKQIEKHFANPMLDAINETTDGLGTNMKMAQTASQVQAYIFQDMLNKAMEKRRQDLDLPKHQMLSADDMRDVFKTVNRIAPIYETNTHEFHIAAQMPEKNAQLVSKSLNGTFESKGEIMGAKNPSVKVSPYMTIGTGDGQMIINIYANADGSLNASLAVFDGVELGVTNAVDGSRQINENTFQAWMEGNTYRSLADGFFQMTSELDQDLMKALSPDTIQNIKKAMNIPKWENVSLAGIKALHTQLEEMADQSEARKHAISQLKTQTDHMAGLEAPYAHGTVDTASNDPTNYQEISDKLNDLARAYMQEKNSEKREAKAKDPIQKPTKALGTYVNAQGKPVENHGGVKTLTGAQLLAYLKVDPDTSKTQKALFNMLQSKDQTSETTYFFGSPEALDAMRQDLPEFSNMREGQIGLGKYHQGKALIANTSPETVLHEMLHSLTFETLKGHYAGQSDPQTKAAVKRLENQMKLARKMPVENDAVRGLHQALDNPKIKSNPAAQMSEFISWMLANQNLVEMAKKKKFYEPFINMMRETLDALKKLLGIKQGPGETLFSNIRFNTEILISKPDEVVRAQQDTQTDQVLEQAYPHNGKDSRLERIERQFITRMMSYLEATRPPKNSVPADRDRRAAEIARRRQMARNASETAIHAGYDLDPRQAHAFEAIHHAMMSGMKLNPALMRKANDMYGHVIQNLRAQDFLDAQGIGENHTEADYAKAVEQTNFLASTEGLRTNKENQSDVLATAMALAQTSDEFRTVLKNMKTPKTNEVKWDSVDNWIESIGRTLMNLLTNLSFKRQKLSSNVNQELDRLADNLSEVQSERRFLASLKIGQTFDVGNDYLARKISDTGKSITQKLEKKSEGTKNKRAKDAIDFASIVTSMISKETSDKTLSSFSKMLNEGSRYDSVMNVLSDFRGTTDQNRGLMRLINPVRAHVDANRQNYREGIPEELARRFNNTLDPEQWTRMFTALGETDFLALGRERALKLLKNPNTVSAEISKREEKIQSLGGQVGSRYLEKAKALAEDMVTGGNTSNHLLTNAYAIANLFGEQGNKKNLIKRQATPELIKAIDELVSLYAFDQTDPKVKKTMQELIKNEPDGMEAVVGTIHHTRHNELERRDRTGKVNEVARINGYKGYIPFVVQQGSSVIVAEDIRFKELKEMGYVRIGEYRGDLSENFRGKRGYYQSTVANRNEFRQGIAQSVHETWQGVDARTGKSIDGMAGLVVGQKAARIAKSVQDGSKNNLKPGEYLRPIFDEDGNVTRYERSMDPKMLSGVKKDKHLGRMLGVWAGRIDEENAADEFNSRLVAEVHKSFKENYVGNENQYVNIADPNNPDPVIRDAWKTLGPRIKEEFAEAFGEKDYVPVLRDEVKDAIGYRAASTTDVWTGISRWDPKTQAEFKKAAKRILGHKAYARLKKSEQVVQDTVSYAKTTIIVRSVQIAYDNLVSNALHLAVRGINPLKAITGIVSKFIEISQYVKNREEINKLEIDIASNYNRTADRLRAEARIKALNDANDKLTIKPLIDAGEFSTISENLTEADVEIREGRLGDYLEKAADKLPGWAQAGVKNVLITKDTALFQALNRMVQYGDFVAKAVLYDHLTEEKKQDKQEAMDEIREEFVSYNRLPGRGRDTLESFGLLWFFSYKLRIQKIVAKMVRDRPLTSLFWMGGVAPSMDIDSVWSGSLYGATTDGHIDFSMGWGMGLRSPSLNPLVNLTS